MLENPLKFVGKSGLQISSLGFGTAFFSTFFTTVPLEDSLQAVHYALAHGINFFDTAPLYGAGESERRLGLALKDVPRENYVLATKVGRVITPDGQVVQDFSRDGIKRSFEESLQRLQLDYVDIVHIHDADNFYREALDNAFPVLADLRSQGIIKAIGAGMNQWEMEAEFARNADFDCFLLAGRYTLLEQGALQEFFPLCQSKNIAVFLGGVFNSGILASGVKPNAKYNYENAPAQVIEKVRRIEAVCARYDVPLQAAALQFPRAHPAVTSIIVGVQSAQEVATNIANLQREIPAAFWQELKAEKLIEPNAPVPV